jgi:hypothetical protein
MVELTARPSFLNNPILSSVMESICFAIQKEQGKISPVPVPVS